MPREERFEWVDLRAEEGRVREAERALLMGLDRGDGTFERTCLEMDELARNARLEPVGWVTQKHDRPHPATYLGKGKVQEAAELLGELQAAVVATSDPLTPAQQRNLERDLDVPVIDRTEVILDIFGHRARSRDGKVQVELAQLQYLLPRLTGRGVMLSRQAGGIGTRGPGETRLEVDRRRIRSRITRLREEIGDISRRRHLERAHGDGEGPFHAALVGYTNAGKSTLLNRLCGSDVYVDDRLFATLDPTTRAVELPGGRRVVVTDTVGFIDHLPTQLVAAFASTLEEAREADLLLHVVDAADPQAAEKVTSVLETLEQIDALDVPMITVLNKADIAPVEGGDLPGIGEDVVRLSALTGEGTEQLMQIVESRAEARDRRIAVLLPFSEMSLVSEIHERGSLFEEEYVANGIRMIVRVPDDLRGRIERYAVRG